MKFKRVARIVLILLLAVVVIIQFLPNDLPANAVDNPADIITNGQASIDVGKILKTSCYDCHSNEVSYPWYSHVAPFSWLVAHDVEEGRDELNFSEWTTLEQRRMIKKLEEIGEEIEEDKMPLPIYTIIHGHAKLSAEQKEIIIQWTRELKDEIIKK